MINFYNKNIDGKEQLYTSKDLSACCSFFISSSVNEKIHKIIFDNFNENKSYDETLNKYINYLRSLGIDVVKENKKIILNFSDFYKSNYLTFCLVRNCFTNKYSIDNIVKLIEYKKYSRKFTPIFIDCLYRMRIVGATSNQFLCTLLRNKEFDSGKINVYIPVPFTINYFHKELNEISLKYSDIQKDVILNYNNQSFTGILTSQYCFDIKQLQSLNKIDQTYNLAKINNDFYSIFPKIEDFADWYVNILKDKKVEIQKLY